MRKVDSGNATPNKRSSRSTAVNCKPVVKKEPPESVPDKKKKTLNISSQSLSLVVVLEKTSIMSSKVKKKQQPPPTKSIPVKKTGPRKIINESSGVKGKVVKTKKDDPVKSVKIKPKKVVESKKKKVIKVETKSKIPDKNLSKKQKKIVVPLDPVPTVLITEPEIEQIPNNKKSKLVKKPSVVSVKKVNPMPGKIVKRKNTDASKLVQKKRISKIVKKEMNQKGTGNMGLLTIDVSENLVKSSKKLSPSRKAKESPQKSPLSKCEKNVSSEKVVDTKAPSLTKKNVVKNIREVVDKKIPEKGPSKKKAQTKLIKNDEQIKKVQIEIHNGEINDQGALELVNLNVVHRTTKKVEIGKVTNKKQKSSGDNKLIKLENTGTASLNPNDKKSMENTENTHLNSNVKKTNLVEKVKKKDVKSKKTVKLPNKSKLAKSSNSKNIENVTKKKSNMAVDSNDTSTSDEIPLEILKKQCVSRVEPPAAVKTESSKDLNFDNSGNNDLKIKKEIVSEISEEDRDVEDPKLLNIKSETPKDSVIDKKSIKVENNVSIPKKTKNIKSRIQKCSGKVDAKSKKNVSKLNKNTLKSEEDSSSSTVSSKKFKKDNGSDSDIRARRMKLFGFWSGPKRHRVASLNAIAKVHCLYENESRNIQLEAPISFTNTSKSAVKKPEPKPKPEKVTKPSDSLALNRTLRTAPGLRSVGRHYDVLNASSTTTTSSSSDDSSDSADDKKLVLQPSVKQKQKIHGSENTSEEEDKESEKTKSGSEEKKDEGSGKKLKRRRKRSELVMDFKDMVVRKRMASLNASAILAASYSLEKRSSSSSTTRKDDSEDDSSSRGKIDRKRKSTKSVSISSPDMEVEDSSCEEDVLIRSGGRKSKVSVIVNDTADVTITGVYLNSTTRSTHHEGFCSIAGMQYKISSTSHTQTEATAVSTEMVLHTDHAAIEPAPPNGPPVAAPCKSYTPLGALSSMQPPGQQRPRLEPPPNLGRRHNCSSAFSAPPSQQDPGYVHGYYQPAGPLISHHPIYLPSTSNTGKIQSHQPPTPPPPPVSESPDTEVAISTSSAEHTPPVSYRYSSNPQYYHHYYPSPPATGAGLQYSGQSHYHPEFCNTSSGYPPGPYFHKAPYPPHGYHQRYVHPPYYTSDVYANSSNPAGPPPPPGPSQQMIVTAPPSMARTSSSYPSPSEPSSYPPGPPAPIMDSGSYPSAPPAPGIYYPYGSGPPPPPPCYSHSPPSRGLYIADNYQGCPCPLNQCPKNVHTGPLTGASKGSLKNQTTATPLPPVALALPSEPPGALGPPSPARGSAGMPHPPSPALGTARNTSLDWHKDADTRADSGLLAISQAVCASVLSGTEVDTNILDSSIGIHISKDEDVIQDENLMESEVVPKNISVNAKRKLLNSFCGNAGDKKTDVKIGYKNLPDVVPQKNTVTFNDTIQTDIMESTIEKEPVPILNKTLTNKMKTVKRKLLDINVVENKKVKLNEDINCDNDVKVVRIEENIKKEPVPLPNKVVTKTVKTVKPRKLIDKVKTKQNKCATEIETKSEEIVELQVQKKPAKNTVSKVAKKRQQSLSNNEPEETAQDVPPKKQCKSNSKSEEKKTSNCKLGRPNKKKKAVSTKGNKKVVDQTVKESPVQNNRHCDSGAKTIDKNDSVTPQSDMQLVKFNRALNAPKWSNGWSWVGKPFKCKVYLNSNDAPVTRYCYESMQHIEGDTIRPYDCILLKSGTRKVDLPFVAKVSALWENPEDGEMMVSLLWYYRPEHTERGRKPEDNVDEIFASRHKDHNSVACIEDKCYVLTFNEYCRYRSMVRRIEQRVPPKTSIVPSLPKKITYFRSQRLPPRQVAPDMVLYCRRVYDYRTKKLMKHPS